MRTVAAEAIIARYTPLAYQHTAEIQTVRPSRADADRSLRSRL